MSYYIIELFIDESIIICVPNFRQLYNAYKILNYFKISFYYNPIGYVIKKKYQLA